MTLIRLLITSLTILIISGCMAAAPVAKKDQIIQYVIELPGKSKPDIFEQSKQWIAQTFKSAKAVIEYENKEEGIIIGNGSINRPTSGVYLGSGGHLIAFNMKEEIKEQKARISFENLKISWPSSYAQFLGHIPAGEQPLQYQGDLDGAKENFSIMTKDLQTYILRSSKDNNW